MSPMPAPDADTRPFWDACAKGELIYQVCSRCDAIQTFPRRYCTACLSDALYWKPSAGAGEIHTFTTVYRAPTQAFKAKVPYVIALVDFAEGFRMMLNVCGSGREHVAIGDPVRVVFDAPGSGSCLPHAELCK